MTMPDRIPLPEGVTPPFVAHNCRVTGGNGGHFLTNPSLAPWIARVLTAYYAEQSEAPSQPVGAPQFVVVNWNDGDEENEMGVATCDISEIGDVVRLRNGREIPIVEAEYTRLKSILAPGQ